MDIHYCLQFCTKLENRFTKEKKLFTQIYLNMFLKEKNSIGYGNNKSLKPYGIATFWFYP